MNAARARAAGPGTPDLPPEQRVFEILKFIGGLPEGIGGDEFSKFSTFLQDLEGAPGTIFAYQQKRANLRQSGQGIASYERVAYEDASRMLAKYGPMLDFLRQEREAQRAERIPSDFRTEDEFGPGAAAIKAFEDAMRPGRARSRAAASLNPFEDAGVTLDQLSESAGMSRAAADGVAAAARAVGSLGAGGLAGMVVNIGTNYAAPDRRRVTARRQTLTPGGADVNAPTR